MNQWEELGAFISRAINLRSMVAEYRLFVTTKLREAVVV